MEFKTFNFLPEFGTNTYLVWDEVSLDAMLIDIAASDEQIINEIEKLGLNLKYLVNTHGHGDHIGGNSMIKNRYDVKLIIHKADNDMLSDSAKNLSLYWDQNIISPAADIQITGTYTFLLGEKEVMLIPTPGHSLGGISILVEGLLFSGDTLFAESIGRTDLPGGNYDVLIKSIKDKLFTLPESVRVFPGHGPETTIGDEVVKNPFAGLAAKL